MKKIILTVVFLLFVNSFAFAQNKVDLEISVQPSSATARGGELFSYTITVSNIGSAKATDVNLINVAEGLITFVSNSAGRGACRLDKPDYKTNLYCSVGDLEAAETVTILVQIRIADFGDTSDSSKAELPDGLLDALEALGDKSRKSNIQVNSIGTVWGSAQEAEENIENNQAGIYVQLLPSLNNPPRIEAVSPKNDAVVIKSVKESLEVTVVVKAFDPDGKIERVTIPKGDYQIDWEDRKYIIEGKKYTDEDIRSDPNYFRRFFEMEIKPSSKDTYTFVLKNVKYGRNIFFVSATDDGGRSASLRLDFTIKSDAEIEISMPQNEQVFTPSSTITVEATSKISDSAIKKLILRGTKEFYSDTNPPEMRQISKAGNIYKHQFIWKNLPEGVHSLRVVLFENGLETNSSDEVRIVVAEKRVFKVTSLKNGQEFESGKNIEIAVEIRDIKGQIVCDELELLIDGKPYSSAINNALCENSFPKSYIWQAAYIEKGVHAIQIIAKNQYSMKLGESEIITIKVK